MKELRESKPRGVFAKVPGSGIWWIRYFDPYRKKLPELFRKPMINFGQLADDALA